MTFSLLTQQHLKILSLTGGYTGSSESIHVKIPHCWKSHVAAHLVCPCELMEIAITLMLNSLLV